MDGSLSPIPQHGVGDEAREALEVARREATLAVLEAEKAERTAKQKRKQANWLIKQYERQVLEHGGQLRLPL